MKNDLQTISWDNANIYKNFQDPKITSDIQFVEQKISYLNEKLSVFEKLIPVIETKSTAELSETIFLARETYRLSLDLSIFIFTLSEFASMASSVDALDYDAKNLGAKSTQLFAELNKATKPLNLFLLRAPSDYLDTFLKDSSVDEMDFSLRHSRKENDFLLGVSEEILLEGHATDGFHSWGKLYSDISGAMKVEVAEKTIGLAQASNILFENNRPDREVAYRAINKSWMQNEISAGAILNSITGWRTENNKARSKKRDLHYLDKSCHQQKINRATLDTLMQTTYEQRHIGQQALKLMAQEMGIEKLAPWDILAPYPTKGTKKNISFPEAIEIISQAFKKFNPDMADFANHMVKKRWIDATPSSNRKSGAYCSGFVSVREPRIFITYEGNMKNVITLAHEIGHAYHRWVMSDLKVGQTHYSSALAETASIFAETLVRDAILENANTREEKKEILWQELESAQSLLINIPARFEFEKQLCELRKIKSVTVPEFKDLTNKAWKLWYEDTLTEYNEMFWASKLHFSMTKLSFYNYPYLFGYLFSLGIYAKKNEYGEKFKSLYIAILRDTGSMTAEDLIQKYFSDDISKKEFWNKSLSIVEKSVQAFQNL